MGFVAFVKGNLKQEQRQKNIESIYFKFRRPPVDITTTVLCLNSKPGARVRSRGVMLGKKNFAPLPTKGRFDDSSFGQMGNFF